MAASGGTVRLRCRRPSSLPKGVYNPKTFIPHAASLRQAVAHCAIFLTAASRRSLARVAVPVWLIVLSDQLPVDALVGRYPTNKLMGRKLILWRPKALVLRHHLVLAPVSRSCPSPKGRLLTRYSPVRRFTLHPKVDFSHDVHVLGTPPAFVLSQDQTLRWKKLGSIQ